MREIVSEASPRWFESLPSTNAWLKDRILAGESIASGTVVAARTQTAGRGRKDRQWETGCGNLACSIYVFTSRPSVEWPTLPMIGALAVGKYLERQGIPAELKWPNDVLVRGRKICGILSEVVRMESRCAHVVIGIGVNLNMNEDECARIDRPATSVSLERGGPADPEGFLDSLLPELRRSIEHWERNGFAGVRGQWMDRAAMLGETVQIEHDRGRYVGRFTDIGEHGEMLLVTSDGPRSIHLGEVL